MHQSISGMCCLFGSYEPAERAKNDVDYKLSIIKRLEAEITEQNLKQKEEVDSVQTKLTSQMKILEIARDKAFQVSKLH